jgi:hypothetical protein
VGGLARLRHWVHTLTDEKTRERLPVSRADLTGLIIAYAGTLLTSLEEEIRKPGEKQDRRPLGTTC